MNNIILTKIMRSLPVAHCKYCKYKDKFVAKIWPMKSKYECKTVLRRSLWHSVYYTYGFDFADLTKWKPNNVKISVTQLTSVRFNISWWLIDFCVVTLKISSCLRYAPNWFLIMIRQLLNLCRMCQQLVKTLRT